jgi:hypothetical protein
MMTKGKQLENNRAHAALVKMDGWTDGRTDGEMTPVTDFSINIKRNQTNQQFAAAARRCRAILFSFFYYYLIFLIIIIRFPFFFYLISHSNGHAKKKGVQTRAYSRHLETVERKKRQREI